MFAVSFTGLGERKIVPESAIPFIPVSMMLDMSCAVIPPIATMGMVMPFFRHFSMMLRYPSIPKIGLRFFFVSVNRKGPNPM